MSVERVDPLEILPDLPEPAVRPESSSRLALVGFGLGILSFALWASVGLPAPLVGVLAIILSWLALRRAKRKTDPEAVAAPTPWLARWGLRLGLIKLALFVVVLLVFGVTAFSQLAV